MAQGPDPNRHFHTDPELTADEIRRGAGPGDPSTTRLGLSSWTSAFLAALVVALLIVLLL